MHDTSSHTPTPQRASVEPQSPDSFDRFGALTKQQARHRAMLVAMTTAASAAASALLARLTAAPDGIVVAIAALAGTFFGAAIAMATVVSPAKKELIGRRWLIRTLGDLSRLNREGEFRVLLEHGAENGVPDIASACYEALLSAHQDRLEAAVLRREMEDRVERRTRVAVAQLSKISNTDELTGVLNRRGFEQAIVEIWNAAANDGQELALLAIDLDHFKKLNDTCGHDKGDDALRAVGDVLRANLRYGDIAGRVGGDELIVCLLGTEIQSARAVGERFMALFSNHPASAGLPWPTMSIGIACAGAHSAKDPTHLRRMADEALYAAKKGGRAACVVFGDQIKAMNSTSDAA